MKKMLIFWGKAFGHSWRTFKNTFLSGLLEILKLFSIILLYSILVFSGAKFLTRIPILNLAVDDIIIGTAGLILFILLFLIYTIVISPVHLFWDAENRFSELYDRCFPDALKVSVSIMPALEFSDKKGIRHVLFVSIENKLNKKILDLQASANFNVQEYFPEDEDVYLKTISDSKLSYGLSGVRKSIVDLRPGEEGKIVLCEIPETYDAASGKRIYSAFLKVGGKDLIILNECIVIIQLTFNGIVSGEDSFRSYIYHGSFFVNPKEKEIVQFDKSKMSSLAIPQKLRSKISYPQKT